MLQQNIEYIYCYVNYNISGLVPLYWYSACIHAHNESVVWELFWDRWNYQSKKICRGKFERKKAR